MRKREQKAQDKLPEVKFQNTNDSILRQSEHEEGVSPNTSARRNTRGLGKKTIKRQSTINVDQ